MPDDTASLLRKRLELRQEQLRRQCMRSFTAFAIQALSPIGEIPARHHQRLIAELEAVARGDTKRLMVLMPPGSAKTTYASRLFPAWFFANHPNTSIIGASHTQALAETNSGFVQRYVRENGDVLPYSLTNEAVSHWTTSNGCRFRAIGANTAAPGYRADLIIADDVVAGRQEAESEVAREHLWDWWTADVLPRLRPAGAVILIGTRYHEADLMGRLERSEGSEWRILRLPAIAEANDPLGRQEGEPLWNDDAYGYGQRLLELRDQYERQGLTRDWYSLYMGAPRAPEGNLFRPAEIRLFDYLPPIANSIRAWDLASSTTGDWSVGLRLGILADAQYDNLPIVMDVQRFRGRPDEVRQRVMAIAESDGQSVPILLPQDPAQAGQDQAESYIRMLLGWSVTAERQSGSKEIRADACASQLNIGRVGMLKASWNAAFVDELGAFPNGRFDDQVDALASAFNSITARPPMRFDPEELRKLGVNIDGPQRRRDPFAPSAYHVARGMGW